jgi:hypothetical protein
MVLAALLNEDYGQASYPDILMNGIYPGEDDA